MPSVVLLMTYQSARITATETPAATIRALLRKIAMIPSGGSGMNQASEESGVRIDSSSAPKRIIAPFCRISAMPSVRISWA